MKEKLLYSALAFILVIGLCIAVFPSSVGAANRLLGTDNNGTGRGSAPNQITMCRWVASASGDVNQFKIQISQACNVKVAIYADSGGCASTLLGAVNVGQPVVVGWNTITFPDTPVVTGMAYWLAQISDISSGNYVCYNVDQNYTIAYKYQAYPGYSWDSVISGVTVVSGYYYCTAGYGSAQPSNDISVVVGTSTTNWNTGWPGQRYTFKASGLYWAWYSDGSNMVFRTSLDKITWSAPNTARLGVSQGYWFSVAYDGSNVHYCWTNSSVWGSDMYYRMGQTNANGTVTWLADEQTAWAVDASHMLSDPSIGIDSNGYPWIATAYQDTNWNAYGYVLKSSTKNGFWTNETSLFTSPYQFSNARYNTSPIVHPCAWCSIVPLTNGKVYAIVHTCGDAAVGDAEKNMTGNLWNGSSWTGQETCVQSPHILSASVSPVSSNDDVCITYGIWNPFPINSDTYFTKRVYSSSSWSTPDPVRVRSTGQCTQSALSIDSSGTLYCFWQDEPVVNHVYYKKYINGLWDSSPTDWFTSDEILQEHGFHPIVSDKAYNNQIIFLFSTKTVSPYNVRVAVLPTEETCEPVIVPVQTTVASQWNGNFNSLFAGSVSGSFEYSIENNGGEPAIFTVTSDTGFYNGCLQISTETIFWEYVGAGWQTPELQPGSSCPVWFRVNVPLGTPSETYSGNIVISQND